jgi:hypothetical protein
MPRQYNDPALTNALHWLFELDKRTVAQRVLNCSVRVLRELECQLEDTQKTKHCKQVAIAFDIFMTNVLIFVHFVNFVHHVLRRYTLFFGLDLSNKN